MKSTDSKTRTRLIGALFAGNTFSSTAFIGTITVSSLIAEQITGSTSISGVPGTMSTIGTAVGATALSALSFKIGRRRAFTAGFAVAMIGSMLAVASISAGSIPILFIAMTFLGFGNSISQLARFAAGDLRPPQQRASAISIIVWAATIGAVAGPLLIGPTGEIASQSGFDQLAGPVGVGIIGYTIAAMIMFFGLRPEPLTLTIAPESKHPDEASTIREIFAIRSVRLAMAALVTSQTVMVMIMAMTPLHVKGNGGGLGTIGIIMMAHTLGMFAIAPITGKLVDRYGPRRVITLSVCVLIVSSLTAASASSADTAVLVVGLFLLGVGWNFGFVAASTELQLGLPIADRLKIQGVADSITWISGGVGAAVSGVIVGASSFVLLALSGAVLALAPIPLIVRTRSQG